MNETLNTGNLNDLYMEIIMEHYKSPRNKKDLSHIDESEIHENPSCGDSIKLEVIMGDDDRISKLNHDCHGCAISTASASMMSEMLSGKTKDEARKIIEDFLQIMRGNKPVEELEKWGDIAVFSGVVQYPLRIKCAVLAWHALNNAIAD